MNSEAILILVNLFLLLMGVICRPEAFFNESSVDLSEVSFYPRASLQYGEDRHISLMCGDSGYSKCQDGTTQCCNQGFKCCCVSTNCVCCASTAFCYSNGNTAVCSASRRPTTLPTKSPTTTPTRLPSSSLPTVTPTVLPSTTIPTTFPTRQPSANPTAIPTRIPTFTPSIRPTSKSPTYSPSKQPSKQPSVQPSAPPTLSAQPSQTPFPTKSPSPRPTSPQVSSSSAATSNNDNALSSSAVIAISVVIPIVAIALIVLFCRYYYTSIFEKVSLRETNFRLKLVTDFVRFVLILCTYAVSGVDTSISNGYNGSTYRKFFEISIASLMLFGWFLEIVIWGNHYFYQNCKDWRLKFTIIINFVVFLGAFVPLIAYFTAEKCYYCYYCQYDAGYYTVYPGDDKICSSLSYCPVEYQCDFENSLVPIILMIIFLAGILLFDGARFYLESLNFYSPSPRGVASRGIRVEALELEL